VYSWSSSPWKLFYNSSQHKNYSRLLLEKETVIWLVKRFHSEIHKLIQLGKGHLGDLEMPIHEIITLKLILKQI
jgi:hypothetical protein